MNYEELLQAMLDRVPAGNDKREGSPIYMALAPIAAQLAEQWVLDETVQDATMPDTAAGDDLGRVCAAFGVNRRAASFAVRKGLFCDQNEKPTDVALGLRFGAENILYTVTKKQTTGVYELTCQTPGGIGNLYFGAILPIDNARNVGVATLADILIAGEDAETDDALRLRYYKLVNTRQGVGNVAQYEAEILACDGVDGVKVFPTPDGQGGKVQCVIVAPDNLPASAALVARVQEIIDPDPHGKGYGLAPIGHTVTISTVAETPIAVFAEIALFSGYTIAGLQESVEQAVGGYFRQLAFVDGVVRISRVEAAILSVAGVADISAATLNGSAENIILPALWNDYQIPVLGTVTLAEVV